MRGLLAALALSLACAPVRRPPFREPAPGELEATTARGRLLAAFDRAAWDGSEALDDLHPDRSRLRWYIAGRTDAGWAVRFGKLDAEGLRFLVAYEATRDGRGKYRAVEIQPPRPETGYTLAAARALEATLGHLVSERSYSYAVFPDPDGRLLVYSYPAQSETGTIPLGADTRWTLSPDGSTVLERRLMHKAIINLPLNSGAVMVIHSHELSEEVEDTDVALAIAMNQANYVTMRSGALFAIDRAGNIQLMQRPGEPKL